MSVAPEYPVISLHAAVHLHVLKIFVINLCAATLAVPRSALDEPLEVGNESLASKLNILGSAEVLKVQHGPCG